MILFLKFQKTEENVLVGYSDADWAGDLDDRYSTSAEAEYVSLCSATQAAVWLRRLLHDINCNEGAPTVIKEDNQGTIVIA
uniref:Reverse transcriptase Ty1/copia-type domain-containing protein n=1 Tax=Amphimedon queenslandica TaxID=400682 RepID=A0A1X7TEV7_AMPQE